MSAKAAIIDRSQHTLAIAGSVIRRDAWTALGETSSLLEHAESIRNGARAEVDAERALARREGVEAGRREGLSQVAAELVRVHNEARAFTVREEARIADLACAVVSRIAPRLVGLVPALALEAVRELQADQYLVVRVHPDQLAAVEAEMNQLREAQPGVAQIQVAADAELAPQGCVLVSESGKIEAGLDEQIAALRVAMRRAATPVGEAAG